jgi:hypothetical protein
MLSLSLSAALSTAGYGACFYCCLHAGICAFTFINVAVLVQFAFHALK